MPTTDQQQFQSVPLEALEVGATLECPVYDDRGDQDVLLVSGGASITGELLRKLQARGITAIRVAKADLQQMRAFGNQAEAGNGELPEGITANSHLHAVKQHGAVTYDAETTRRFIDNYDQSLDQIGDFFEVLSSGNAKDTDIADSVSSGNVTKLTNDLDLFVSLGMGDRNDKYPYRHSLQTMMLATSIGTTMGLTHAQLTDLGIGCLLHDSGMMMIDRKAWDKRGGLSGYDRLEITKHPRFAFDKVSRIAKVPNGARMIVFQMHERMNGTGYPRQRTAAQIYPLSRIAMVADVFVALVSPRPHRPGLMPYQAMEHIIKQAKEGLLDSKVVRGLLKTVSLFPITSYVVMNDGRVGKVIRSTGETYTRPIVDLWRPENTKADPETVDLTANQKLEVARPLTKFEADQLGLVKPTGTT